MERNRIYNENCLNTLSRLQDQSIDLTVTSPPYNMRLRVNSGKYTFREKTKHMSKKYEHFDDALPIDEFYMLHTEIMSELLRVSKIVCYNFQVVTGSKEAFFRIVGDFHKHIKDIVVWDKINAEPAMHPNVMNAQHELILVLERDSGPGRALANSYFERGLMPNLIRVPKNRKAPKSHGAVFPEEIPLSLISAFSPAGGLVYDPFMGTGTTALAALRVGRDFIGSEISAEYTHIAQERVNLALKEIYKDMF